MKALTTLLVASTVLPVAAGQHGDDPVRRCDTSAIRWVLPGRFDDAVARARKEKRLIMVKGVSFGIDAVGATCATKGTW